MGNNIGKEKEVSWKYLEALLNGGRSLQAARENIIADGRVDPPDDEKAVKEEVAFDIIFEDYESVFIDAFEDAFHSDKYEDFPSDFFYNDADELADSFFSSDDRWNIPEIISEDIVSGKYADWDEITHAFETEADKYIKEITDKCISRVKDMLKSHIREQGGSPLSALQAIRVEVGEESSMKIILDSYLKKNGIDSEEKLEKFALSLAGGSRRSHDRKDNEPDIGR